MQQKPLSRMRSLTRMCSLTKSGGQVKEVEVVARRTPGPMGASQGFFFFIFSLFFREVGEIARRPPGQWARVKMLFFYYFYFICLLI
jgi:hypothetical protein